MLPKGVVDLAERLGTTALWLVLSVVMFWMIARIGVPLFKFWQQSKVDQLTAIDIAFKTISEIRTTSISEADFEKAKQHIMEIVGIRNLPQAPTGDSSPQTILDIENDIKSALHSINLNRSALIVSLCVAILFNPILFGSYLLSGRHVSFHGINYVVTYTYPGGGTPETYGTFLASLLVMGFVFGIIRLFLPLSRLSIQFTVGFISMLYLYMIFSFI